MFFWTPSSSHFARRLAAKTSDSCACHLRMHNGACRAALRAAASRVVENREAEGPVPHRSCLFFCFGSSSRTLQGWERPLQPATGPPPSSAVLSLRRPNIRGSGLPRPCSLRVHDAYQLWPKKCARTAHFLALTRVVKGTDLASLLCSVGDAGPAKSQPVGTCCGSQPLKKNLRDFCRQSVSRLLYCVPLESLELLACRLGVCVAPSAKSGSLRSTALSNNI